MNEKPGVKTSEMWVIVGGAILSVIVANGYITPAEAEYVTTATQQTAIALTELAKALAPIAGAIVYVWSRTKIKTS